MTRTAAKPKSKITTPNDREIHIERIVNATRDRVWRAYADPLLVAQWWGRGNRLVIERMEMERGGHWRYVEHSPNGVFGFEGRYREVTPPERFVRSFEWDGMPAHVAIETVTFEDLGDGRTRISSVLQMHTPEERDGFLQSGMQEGMDASYAQLDKLLAAS
jgi:uncharacterized protein YndB with AHSA1/START domain